MRVFITACLSLALLICGTLLYSAYVGNVCDELEAAALSSDGGTAASEALWQRHRDILSVGVMYDRITAVDAALSDGDVGELVKSIRRLRDSECFSVRNII
nr:hypothetical protein [Clostridia bacterium]